MRLWLSFSQSYHIRQQDARANCCSFPQTYNQIRQIGNRRGPAIRGYIPDWQQVTPWHMRMYRRNQISQDSRRQDHRLQDLPERRHKWRYQSRERSCYLVKLTKLYAKKPAARQIGGYGNISNTLKRGNRPKNGCLRFVLKTYKGGGAGDGETSAHRSAAGV